MNLKSACKIAIIIMTISILLAMTGYALIYTQIRLHQSHSININFVARILAFLLQPESLAFLLRAGGFLAFLLAFITQPKELSSNSLIFFVLTGILILLGTLITAASSLGLIHTDYQYFGFPLFVLIMAVHGFLFLSGLCLSIFIFLQARKAQAAKFIAIIILGINLILCVLLSINVVVRHLQDWNTPSIIYCISVLATSLGHLANLVAVIIFMLAFVKHRPWPPEAGVLDPSPVPAPVLSAEEPLPGEE